MRKVAIMTIFALGAWGQAAFGQGEPQNLEGVGTLEAEIEPGNVKIPFQTAGETELAAAHPESSLAVARRAYANVMSQLVAPPDPSELGHDLAAFVREQKQRQVYEDVCTWSRRVAEGGLVLVTEKEKKLAFLDAHVKRVAQFETMLQQLSDAGQWVWRELETMQWCHARAKEAYAEAAKTL